MAEQRGSDLAHPLAWRDWQDEKKCRELVMLWMYDEAKREAEQIVGRLVRALGKHDTIIELGCGIGLNIPHLPRFKRYLGYDTSAHLIAEAMDRYEGDSRCRFDMRDMFDIPRYRISHPVDVVICVHVARHYLDPLEVLRQALRWPARGYVLSALHSRQRMELLNGVSLSTSELDAFMNEAGEIVGTMEQPVGNGLSVRYFAVRRQQDG
ncbi:MAG: hypothetical protein Kow0047_15820 [Anaerolineae bacterium]